VEYNTSTNPVEDGLVQDTSGRGLDGVLVGGVSYSASQKALEFDGTDDYIFTGNLQNSGGDIDFTISMWVKPDTVTSSTQSPFLLGKEATNKAIGLNFTATNVDFFVVGGAAYNYTTSGIFDTGSWKHFILYRRSGSMGVYVNGVYITPNVTGSGSLDLPQTTQFTLGNRDTVGNYFNGSISNFKLYDTALTAEEVKTLYDMGRCDEGGHVVNFSKTRVGIGLGDEEVPRGVLDVRGDVVVSGPKFTVTSAGNVGIGTDNPVSSTKLETRGNVLFDLSNGDTIPTGLYNYMSTQLLIDTPVYLSRGTTTASTDIEPPPGVAGDVICKFINSTTTEAVALSIPINMPVTTGDTIYLGGWYYAPSTNIVVQHFLGAGGGPNLNYAVRGDATWRWIERTLTAANTYSSGYRIDNDTPGGTIYITGLTVRKNPSQTTNLPFTPRYSPHDGIGSVFTTQNIVAKEAAIRTLTGNVGIGTNSPQSPFHVNPINGTENSENAFLDFRHEFSPHGHLGIFATETHTNGVGPDLRFKGSIYNGTATPTINQVMCLKPGGTVGIGTDNPSQKLDVNGYSRLRSGLYSGSISISAPANGGWTNVKNLAIAEFVEATVMWNSDDSGTHFVAAGRTFSSFNGGVFDTPFYQSDRHDGAQFRTNGTWLQFSQNYSLVRPTKIRWTIINANVD